VASGDFQKTPVERGTLKGTMAVKKKKHFYASKGMQHVSTVVDQDLYLKLREIMDFNDLSMMRLLRHILYDWTKNHKEAL
jgi:hypothetical protein